MIEEIVVEELYLLCPHLMEAQDDLVLAVEVLKKLNIPFGIAINRSDIGDDGVENYCEDNNIPILMRIPFDREIAFLYSKGLPIVNEKKEYIKKFQDMFSEIEEIVKSQPIIL